MSQERWTKRAARKNSRAYAVGKPKGVGQRRADTSDEDSDEVSDEDSFSEDSGSEEPGSEELGSQDESEGGQVDERNVVVTMQHVHVSGSAARSFSWPKLFKNAESSQVSPLSPLHLPRTSPVSPLHLPSGAP